MTPAQLSCDVGVLGGGPGGCAAALRSAARGAKTCLIEARELGGACTNVGCIPTKAMLAASKLLWRARHGGRLGVLGAGLSLDQSALASHAAEVVRTVRSGLEKKIASARNLELIHGRGRLTARDSLAVETEAGSMVIQAGAIILATGSRPLRPDLPGSAGPGVVTRNEAATAGELPEGIVVVGGGVLGCEFATLYSELGVPTQLVEMREGLLPGMDAEAGEAATKLLAYRSVEVLTGRKLIGIAAGQEGVVAELDDGRKLKAAEVLLALGRRSNVEQVGLGSAGVELGDGIVPVDDRCRTNVEGIYAVGDVAEKRRYAHLAERMGVVAAENATGHELRDDRSVIPIGAYTHPQIASVGLTERQARESFGRVRVLRSSYRASGAALACGQTNGLVKILAEAETGRILGALWVVPHALEMIHELALAMREGLTLEAIGRTIHAHPTFQEGLSAAVEAWFARAGRKPSGRS